VSSTTAVRSPRRRGELDDGRSLTTPTGLGVDGAGVIDEIGDDVSGWTVGDEVIGIGQDVQAEYATLAAWATKPAAMDWESAGAMGLIGETATRGLTLLGIGAGDTVFIDGASGGVGTLAI